MQSVSVKSAQRAIVVVWSRSYQLETVSTTFARYMTVWSMEFYFLALGAVVRSPGPPSPNHDKYLAVVLVVLMEEIT
ncbi:MAG: hypothetical protein CK545_01635 [Actinobacteria bacterium]|nr:MAG: hypothetical protein CK545_01635 [Actinomycetota bacterium]